MAVRANAAFAKPEIYDALETRAIQYAIRIPANKPLELAIEDVLFRSPGRPSRTPLVRYKSLRYQVEAGPRPDGRWREQMARNLTDPVDGFLRTARQGSTQNRIVSIPFSEFHHRLLAVAAGDAKSHVRVLRLALQWLRTHWGSQISSAERPP